MKRLLVLMIGLAAVFAFAGCGGGDDSGSTPGEKEYVAEAELSKALADPEAYKGKYIKVSGQVFNVVERDGDSVTLQGWHDPSKAEEGFIVTAKTDEDFKDEDYIIVDGKIEGEYSGENAFGGDVAMVQITADTIEKSDYTSAVAPAKETRDVNQSVTEAGATFTVEKVEFADKETRIYVSVKNDSDYEVSAYTGSAQIIQDGEQYEADYNIDAEYPEIDEVAAHASKEGIICVSPLDPEKEITLHVDGDTENYDIDMNDFELTF